MADPFTWIAVGVAAVGAVVGATTSIIGASQQSAALAQQQQAAQAAAQAQQQQAENTRAIAQYNADIQRQNNDVTYQLALYQSQLDQQTAALNQSMALANEQFAEQQELMARSAYDQQLANAEAMRAEANIARLQAAEEADRQRETNDAALANIRAKSAAGGVTFEGTPLVVLSDAARIGETIVQDLAYTGDLESRKTLREADIEQSDARFHMLEAKGFDVEASNYAMQAQQFQFDEDLALYDAAIASASKRIGDNYATLTELGGEEKAFSYEFQAQQSLYSASAYGMQASAATTAGYAGAASSLVSGASAISSAYKTSTYKPKA